MLLLSLLYFFFQKSEWPCDLPPKRPSACNAKFHPGLREVRKYIRTILSEPKFLGYIDKQSLDGIKNRKTDVQGYIQQLLHEDEFDMTDYPGSVSWDNNP